jgi:hypothetical protein
MNGVSSETVIAWPFKPCFFVLLRSPGYIIAFAWGALGGNYCLWRIPHWAVSSRCRFELTSALLGAEIMSFAFCIAQSFAQEDTAPFAVTFPSPVGSATSRHTFHDVSIVAWLGIVLGITRSDVPRIHPIYIGGSMYLPVARSAQRQPIADIPPQVLVRLIRQNMMRLKLYAGCPALAAGGVVAANNFPRP